jgi:hypothetical protein
MYSKHARRIEDGLTGVDYRPNSSPSSFASASTISSATRDANPANALGSVPTGKLSFRPLCQKVR